MLSAWDFSDENANVKKYDFCEMGWTVLTASTSRTLCHHVQDCVKCMSIIVYMRVNFK